MEAKIGAKAGADARRNVKTLALTNWVTLTAIIWWAGRAAGHWAASIATIRGIEQAGAQDNGINHLNDSYGKIATTYGVLIHIIQTTFRAKDLGVAFTAKEENTLVKDS